MTIEATAKMRSLTIPESLFVQVEERTGPRGLRAYVENALATQLEIDRLGDYVAAAQAHNGPVPEDVREQFHTDLASADAEIGYTR